MPSTSFRDALGRALLHLDQKAALEQEVTAWQARRNATKVTVDWQFTTEDARIKLDGSIQF